MRYEKLFTHVEQRRVLYKSDQQQLAGVLSIYDK